jgi:formylmethanofuran dehydrogenase subunit E
VRKREARFVLDNSGEASYLRKGQEYDYLDGYWGQRAELVLDRARKWTRAEFKPRDAVAFELEGQSISAERGTPLFEGAEAAHRVPGGWTHAHCNICWETIGPSGRKTGYRDQNDEWVCESCYESYVEPKKLDFIPE